MLSINSNISSLVAQQNLNGSSSALSQAITRLSSGKRINSAADDAAGLAISTTLQTAITGLTQGVSNANDGTSMVQTASTGLTQITQSLQLISQLANEAAGGSLSGSNQAALQQEVAQQVAEVNRLASQTNYNGINLLNGTAGNVSVQVGANVGQTITINLSQGVSAASLGSGPVQVGNTVGSITGLDLTSSGAANSTGGTGAITQINILANGTGGFTYTDQNNQVISSSVASNLFTVTGSANGIDSITLNSASASNGLSLDNEMTAINNYFGSTDSAGNAVSSANSGTVLGKLSGLNIDPTSGSTAAAGTANVITSITVETNGAGGFAYVDQNGHQLSSSVAASVFSTTGGTLSFASGTPKSTIYGASSTAATSSASPTGTSLQQINYTNQPTSVAQVDVSTTAGANLAMETVANALSTISNIQATLGAAQNRLTGIATSQQAESTDLSSAQSQITDADFAQETANLSKAQVLQQAGISVLAQANSQPQQVLKLLQ
ncbi:flagellin N-terminal helical domain-containing protein [Paraburkholderia sp. ZP32-5]|uniref:flagellin N-terminal helical domain-containing protein n=1 Tax=Paraburkholderia sp. ZP32-5 TaxID=2883245 RepID=UPI001F47D8D3|nr:flagellin [Paraburkholderia sp. ZP32-5]